MYTITKVVISQFSTLIKRGVIWSNCHLIKLQYLRNRSLRVKRWVSVADTEYSPQIGILENMELNNPLLIETRKDVKPTISSLDRIANCSFEFTAFPHFSYL